MAPRNVYIIVLSCITRSANSMLNLIKPYLLYKVTNPINISNAANDL